MNSILYGSHKQNDFLEANDSGSSKTNYITMILVKIWCDLLNQKTVGIDDSFFYLGSDSISVLKLIFRIQEYFHINLLFRDIFDNPTIHQLAIFIENKLHAASKSNLSKELENKGE
jgi:acyl carrier protein